MPLNHFNPHLASLFSLRLSTIDLSLYRSLSSHTPFDPSSLLSIMDGKEVVVWVRREEGDTNDKIPRYDPPDKQCSFVNHKEPEDSNFFIYEDLFVSQPSNGLIEEIMEARPSKGVVIREPEESVVSTQCSIVGEKNNKDKGKQKLIEDPKVMKPPKKAVQLGWQGSNGVGQSSSGFGSSDVEQNVSDNLLNFDDLDVLDFMQSYGEDLDSEHSDYEPLPEDEDYEKYGDDENDYFVEETGEEQTQLKRSLLCGYVGSSNGEILQYEDDEFFDNEDMFGGVDSDEEPPNYTVNSDGERVEEELYFNPKTDMVRPRFQLNMKFGNVEILRDALRLMALQGGWEFRFKKNDSVRLLAICKQDNCPFKLFASRMQHEDTLNISEWIPKHTCTRTFNNTMVRQKLLVKMFKDRIALNPDWKPESLSKTMSSEIRARVDKQMAYKVKVAALKEIEGSIRDQFARLKDYGNELKRVDPSTTVDIRCDFNNSNKDPIFQRMYICLGALKNGIKSGCRSVVGLDGAFLKSPFGGEILTAVGLDANNCSWVIAYAMVENENKDSWIWFLELLCKDLDIKEDGVGWIFISDKQKGLIPACEVVVPSAEIRFCVRHMWTNFTKLFPGKVLKDQMWKCAKDTTMPYYLKDMEEMNKLDDNAYKWMTHKDRPPRNWCRAFFNTTTNCDIMDNNICESLNAVLVDARKKPPITMFEEIRWRLMKRIQMRRQKMENYEYNICPKPRETLEKNKIRAADCTSTFNGGDSFEVENFEGTKNVVNLRLRTCSCRRWDLTGIPCKHAVSAIYWKRETPEDYVADCYLKKTYMAIYSNFINPVTSMDMWTRCEGPTILPPSYSRMPGRPKTKRAKHQYEKIIPSEGKLGRQQRSLKCGNCGVVGQQENMP